MNLSPLQIAGAGAFQPLADILTDLASLGACTSDGQFIVAVAAGVFQYESGNTVKTSLGLGTGDSPIFTGLTLTGFDGFVTAEDGVLSASNTINLGSSI